MNLILQNMLCKTSSGKLYFGGINGFNSFDIDSMLVNTAKPKIEITLD